jgi:hypothetical protein
MCTLCGSLAHLSVADHAAWYEKQGVPFGTIVPARCPFCWQEIREGDVVVVRTQIVSRDEIKTGDQGVVRSIVTSDGGSIFEVKMQDDKEYRFVRADSASE